MVCKSGFIYVIDTPSDSMTQKCVSKDNNDLHTFENNIKNKDNCKTWDTNINPPKCTSCWSAFDYADY